MDDQAHRLRLVLVNAGIVDLVEDRRRILGRDLVSFFSNCGSDEVFEQVLGEVIRCESVSVEDLKKHLKSLLNQFDDFLVNKDTIRRIEDSPNKSTILEHARTVYKFISKKSVDSNRSE